MSYPTVILTKDEETLADNENQEFSMFLRGKALKIYTLHASASIRLIESVQMI